MKDLSEPFSAAGLLCRKDLPPVALMTKTDRLLPIAVWMDCQPLSPALKVLHDLVSASFLALVLPLCYMYPGLQLHKASHCLSPFSLWTRFCAALLQAQLMTPSLSFKLSQSISCWFEASLALKEIAFLL